MLTGQKQIYNLFDVKLIYQYFTLMYFGPPGWTTYLFSCLHHPRHDDFCSISYLHEDFKQRGSSLTNRKGLFRGNRRAAEIRALPDMMSASNGEGAHVKVDVIMEVAWVLKYKSNLKADTGGKKSEIFADIISGSSQSSDNRMLGSKAPNSSTAYEPPRNHAYIVNLMS